MAATRLPGPTALVPLNITRVMMPRSPVGRHLFDVTSYMHRESLLGAHEMAMIFCPSPFFLFVDDDDGGHAPRTLVRRRLL